MISFGLVLAAVLALFAGSLPMLTIALASLAIKTYPIAALAVIAAVVAWTIHQYWR